MHPLLVALFVKLEQENIQYCLLRDGHNLGQISESGGEIDLLVRPEQLRLLASILRLFDFVNVQAWGHSPHHFFLLYDKETDWWIKLDVVTEVMYGRPIHALQTLLACGCLRHRQRLGQLYIPAPEDEFITLLLHCALDKGHFNEAHKERLQDLCLQIVNEPYLSALLALYWCPVATWPEIAQLVETGRWKSLLSEREAVAERLAATDRMATFGRQARDRTLRKLQRFQNWIRPPARSVALLAPDGAGKSTLAHEIQNSFYYPVCLIYMGLYQKKADVQSNQKITGLSFLRRILTQWQRYLRARYYQTQGRLVVFDRYCYDALLPARHKLSIAKKWRRWLLAHACPPPNLVLVLDAPGEVLYNRKKEHSAVDLEEQRQGYLKLHARVPRMVVVDATRDPDCVRREVTSLIWRSYAS